eukprot:1421902-Amphidinium_carterae.5
MQTTLGSSFVVCRLQLVEPVLRMYVVLPIRIVAVNQWHSCISATSDLEAQTVSQLDPIPDWIHPDMEVCDFSRPATDEA